MGKKLLVLTALGVGYVLGAKAGNERYEQIKKYATKTGILPLLEKAKDTVNDKAQTVIKTQGEKITDTIAETVKERLFTPVDKPTATADEQDKTQD